MDSKYGAIQLGLPFILARVSLKTHMALSFMIDLFIIVNINY